MKTPAKVIAKMVACYKTIQAARAKYAELAPKASSLRGLYVACSPTGMLSLEAPCMFQDVELTGWHFFDAPSR